MPRTGKHPLKMTQDMPEDPRRPITICTVVHIPMLAGYWQDSLDVLKLFFQSLYASTDLSFDLMVFDNNSCKEAQDYLLEQRRDGKIQYLILSEYNLKKLGAMDYLFSCAPGEYVTFVDSDVYLLPEWLEASLEILETFPEAGQVSAIPTIDKRKHFLERTHQGILADANLLVERGDNLVPDAYIEAHRFSIGREREEYLKIAAPREDIRVTRGGVSAFVSAQDFQFTTRKEIIQKVLPLEVRTPEEYYDPIYSPVFESKVDELGYWRLSTTRYLVHHMGNRAPDLSAELAGLLSPGGPASPVESSAPKRRGGSLRRRILESQPARGLLKRLYTLAYSLLFEDAK
jgi:glycosyltransferase involved in cell wall biosynthesis